MPKKELEESLKRLRKMLEISSTKKPRLPKKKE